jgi:hypothetical protein
MKNSSASIRRVAICAASALVLGAPRPSQAAASITIVNADAADKGLNDPRPVAPVGGNAGITLGQQRLIAFSYGATIWGAALDASIGMSISSSFDNLLCTTSGAVLGAAGPTSLYARIFPPPAPQQNVWYVGALASQLAGQDINNGNPAIAATFNAQIGTANCLPDKGWYYGLDGNTGANQYDFVDVVLHEFAHGLGFVSLARPDGSWIVPTGQSQGLPDIWEFTMLDLTTGRLWKDMSNQERVASSVRPRQVVWTGQYARSAARSFLVAGTPTLTVTSPPSLAREYLVGEAEFGPPLSNPGVAGSLTAPLDSTGSSTGCNGFGSQLSGIVLLDRGGCDFVAKVLNAQAAGASAVVIVNNMAGSPPPPMGGTDSTIAIPSVMITQADGLTLRNAIPGVMVNLHLLSALRGADDQDHPMLYTPDQYVLGSSVSHTDQSALLLMDPMYNTRLGHKLDLTPYFFKDIGWRLSNADPPESNPEIVKADIALSVTGSKNFQKDTNVVCNLTVSNNGPSDARDVLLFATAPAGVTLASSSGPCTDFPCSLGTMAAGTHRSFTVSFRVSPSYTDSDLKVTLNAAPPFPDPNTANNSGTVTSHRGVPGAGGCASTGLGEPALAALLLLAFLPRRSRSRA